MMLIDTNILLSAILKQNDYQSSISFLETLKDRSYKGYVSAFALYSICIELHKRKEIKNLKDFFRYFNGFTNIMVYQAAMGDMIEMASLKINLDFDDKLHYYLAKKKNLTLVSYDNHFDKTDIKRLTPKEALNRLEFC